MKEDILSERFRKMYAHDPGLLEHQPEIVAAHLVRYSLAGMTHRLEAAIDRLTKALEKVAGPDGGT